MGFPIALALHVHDLSGAIVAIVGLVALGLALIGLRAYRRSGNDSLRFVVAAFGVFAAKGLFAAWAIVTRRVGHEDLEVVLALADLVVVGLLVAPLFLRNRARAAG